MAETGSITSDMSGALAIDNGLVPAKTSLTQLYEFSPDVIHESLYHCGRYTDLCNEMLDECWPLMRAELYQDFLFRKVPTPILEHTALVHSTPWDWDVRPCARCGKLVGTPVMKTKRAWLGDDYCCACERQLLKDAAN